MKVQLNLIYLHFLWYFYI